MRPTMKLTAEEFDELLVPDDEAPPETERRPDLVEKWVKRMNFVREVCPACNC